MSRRTLQLEPETTSLVRNTACRIPGSAIEIAFVDRSADPFKKPVPAVQRQLFPVHACEGVFLRNPRRLVSRGIIDREHHFERIGACAFESFLHAHMSAVRITK